MRVLFYWIVAFFFRIVMKVYNRVTVRGLDRALTVAPPVIIAANHCSNLDPIVIGAFFPRRLRYLAKSELFRFLPLGLAIKALGAVPANREDLQGSAGAVKFLIERLQAGEDILLFPEGQRSTDGRIQPLEQGVGLLAARTGAPVIPIAVTSAKCWPRRAFVKIPGVVDVSIGKPIASAGREPDELMREVEAWIESEMRRLDPEAYR